MTALTRSIPATSSLRYRLTQTAERIRELGRAQPALVAFACVLLVATGPAFLAMGLDERTLRGANVWAKPIKFMLSVAVFALTTAWFVHLLPEARRRAAPVRVAVWMLIGLGGAEIVYITLQAGLGQASHFNTSSALHATLYQVMGAGAVLLTTTQLVIGWQLWRHAREDVPPLLFSCAALGAFLTFVLGVAAGGLLGSLQPPDGWGLPLVGWHLTGGDLRPAHFVGMHAQQALPFAAWLIVRSRTPRGKVALAGAALGLVVLWAIAMAIGLQGVTAASFGPRPA